MVTMNMSVESLTLPEHQKSDNANISAVIENKLCWYIKSIETHFMKIENNLTGISSSKSTTETGNENDDFYTGMLKNRILELATQLSEKNLDTSTNKNISDNTNNKITNGNNKYNYHDTPMEKSINYKARKEVIIIGDSKLNNINSWGLSKP